MNRIKRHSSKRTDSLDPEKIIEDAVKPKVDNLEELEDRRISNRNKYNSKKSASRRSDIMDSDLIVPYTLTQEKYKDD